MRVKDLSDRKLTEDELNHITGGIARTRVGLIQELLLFVAALIRRLGIGGKGMPKPT